MKEINIKDLFKKEELQEKGDSNYKTICPECGLQGGRTEGFIIFPKTNTSYCHSSKRWFSLLQTAGLILKIIKCIDGNNKNEIPEEDEYKDEIYDGIEEKYNKEFLIIFKIACGDIQDFLIKKTDTKGKITKFVNIDKVSYYLINKFDIKTIYGLKEENIYIYNGGIWSITGKGLIKSETEKLLGLWANNNIVNEILEKIKRKTETSRKEFDIVPEFKRCFLNGVLDIEDIHNIKFISHSKEYNFKNKFPIKYNPKSKCKKIKEFIENTFYPSDIKQVQEWFGLHIPHRYLFKKAVIIHGTKNTGKSVFLNLLTSFIGHDNVADLSLQKISGGRGFDLLVLRDKFGNIHDDLSSKDLNDGGGFKMCVGDGFISGEEKFGDHYRFRNSAKMTFACNKIPSVKDIDDDAYYDRFLPWQLDNIITSKERNIRLINELVNEEELSGLLNYALKGYFRLIEQNKFSNEKTSEEIKDLMIENGNPLARFVSEMLLEDVGNKISKEEMYNQYCHYCISQKPKLSPCSKDQLGKQLSRFAPYILSSSTGKERYWLNGKINSLSNLTPITPFKKLYCCKKEEVKEGFNNTYIKLPKMSYASDDDPQEKGIKLSRIIVKHKQTDREIQFWEAEECKDIVAECSKAEVLDWILKNPKYIHQKLYDKFGIGFYKWESQLKKEGKI